MIMKIISKFLSFAFILVCVFFFSASLVKADDDQLKQIQDKIQEYEKKISDLQGQKKTLASTIAYLDSKINLTQAQIAKTEKEIKITEEEIAKLSLKIGQLDKSLNEISIIFTNRVGATYKNSQIKPLYLLFSSADFSSFLTKVKYLKVAQAQDRAIMVAMEKQKTDFDNQKNLKEKKQTELETLKKTLEAQKTTLAVNKQDKQVLLETTKNDEKKYAEMLAAARAELEAIQSIIAGRGTESEAGSVSNGTKIATVIQGVSACSSGTHLHFEVVRSGAHQNPAGYLKNISIIWDNSPDGQFSFSGSWDWPMDEPIRVTQGYGDTYWSRMGWYGGGPHTGIDINSNNSSSVKSVAEGTLYRGSIACGGGTLRYVHVKHKNDGIDTYYLHVNYY